MRRSFLYAWFAVLLFGPVFRIEASAVPKTWRAVLISIETPTTPQEQQLGSGKFREIGTGFMISPDSKPPLRAILFTAKHVFEAACPLLIVYLRHIASPQDAQGEQKRQELNICRRVPLGQGANIMVFNQPLWTAHPSADIVGILMPPGPNMPNPDDITVFELNIDVATKEKEKQWDIGEGDETYTIAFQPDIVKGQPGSPIFRHGIIAEYSEDADVFWIDSLVFPGNSGSPVVLKPNMIHRTDTGYNIGQVNPPLLVGVVVAFVPYIDVAMSLQTQRPRITFEENSGLARVVRSARVVELLQTMTPFLGAPH